MGRGGGDLGENMNIFWKLAGISWDGVENF